MLLLAIVLSVIWVPCFARPQQARVDSSTPIPIVQFNEENGGDGNFKYSYETGNGIRYDQTGYTKQIPVPLKADGTAEDGSSGIVQVLSGSYSYTDPEGKLISLSYVADENGFQPVGEHLPTPPPIPQGIQEVLSQLPKIQPTN